MTKAADDFRNVRAVLAGARHPLHAGASKVLRLMLDEPPGSDAVVTPHGFAIRVGGHPTRNTFRPALAPAAISVLCDLCSSNGAVSADGGRAVLAAGSVPATDGFPAWSFGPRLLWVEASAAAVSVRVRDATGVADPVAALRVVPEPFGFVRRYLDLRAAAPCPHCARPAERYRRLHDGWLVCPACGRSFPPGRLR